MPELVADAIEEIARPNRGVSFDGASFESDATFAGAAFRARSTSFDGVSFSGKDTSFDDARFAGE